MPWWAAGRKPAVQLPGPFGRGADPIEKLHRLEPWVRQPVTEVDGPAQQADRLRGGTHELGRLGGL